MSEVVVEFQATPNPNAGKFVLDRPSIASGQRRSIMSRTEAAGDLLAERLMAVAGVESLFFVANFITVTKESSAEWENLIPELTQAIREAYG